MGWCGQPLSPGPPHCAHSPSQEGLLQALARGERLPGEHVAHNDVQAARHKGQHSLRLQGAAAGDQAQALQRGALAQRLEELRVGAEVGLLEPVGRGQRETVKQSRPEQAVCPG